MFNLGTGEIIIILIIALMLFGPQQLPEIGKQIGKMMRDFRNMSGDVTRALDLDGHNDYDHTPYQHTAIAPTYHEPAPLDTPTVDEAAHGFAYSAPGNTVAAIDSIRDAEAKAAELDTAPVAATGGARVYNEPVATEATPTTVLTNH